MTNPSHPSEPGDMPAEMAANEPITRAGSSAAAAPQGSAFGHPGEEAFARLRAADPYRGAAPLPAVDLARLRTKVDAILAADGAVSPSSQTRPSSQTAAEARTSGPAVAGGGAGAAGAGAAGDGGAQVISLAARRKARRWVASVGAAAAAAAVGLVAMAGGYFAPGNAGLSADPSPSDSQPGRSGANRADQPFGDLTVLGADEHLEQVGEVQFEAAGSFSTERTQAPAFKVTQSVEVSTGEVAGVARSLGLSGEVTKTGAGYTVSGAGGARLVVTVGKLTSLTYSNPSAMRMECVPVAGESGNVTLPNQSPSATPSNPASPRPTTTSPRPTTTAPSVPAPSISVTPLQPGVTLEPSTSPDPDAEVAPPVRPDLQPSSPSASPETSPSATTAQTESAVAAAVDPAGQVKVEVANTLPALTPAPSATTYSASTYAGVIVPNSTVPRSALATPAPALAQAASPSPNPSTDGETGGENSGVTGGNVTEGSTMVTPTPDTPNCVMQVAGQAPSKEQAVAEVAKVAQALGASVVAQAAGAQSANGVTTLSVPVQMPGQEAPLTWKATVTSNGVATISASLGNTKKIGAYQVISEAEAVARLNDPDFGPLDVTVPAGGSKKISGDVKLVSAQLSTAPVKQKDGTFLSLPVYLITDDQGRVWTVLAVAEAAK